MRLNKRLKTSFMLKINFWKDKQNSDFCEPYRNDNMLPYPIILDHGHNQIGPRLVVLNFQMISEWALLLDPTLGKNIVLICLNPFVVFWKPDRVNFVPDTIMGPKFTLHFRVWYSTHSMGYFQAEVAIIFKLPTQVWNLYSFLLVLHPIFGKRILANPQI